MKRKRDVAPPSPFRAGTVALVGRANVGKSTLLNALVGEPIAIVSQHPQTTRDRIVGVRTDPDAQYVFLDSPGLHRARTKLGARMNSEAEGAARDADVLVLVTDVASDARRPPVRDADAAIARGLPPGKPVVLALNKIDRLGEKAALVPSLEAWSNVRDFQAIVPISARKSDGTERLLSEVRAALPEGAKAFDDDTLTDRPARFFVAEFVREQILRSTREEVPHGVAVIVERFEEVPAKKLTKVAVTVHVDREGHKRIVIGKAGELLKRIGTEARKRIEGMLGVHVHLEIWVRVTPGWYETDSALAEFGYAGRKTEKTV